MQLGVFFSFTPCAFIITKQVRNCIENEHLKFKYLVLASDLSPSVVPSYGCMFFFYLCIGVQYAVAKNGVQSCTAINIDLKYAAVKADISF